MAETKDRATAPDPAAQPAPAAAPEPKPKPKGRFSPARLGGMLIDYVSGSIIPALPVLIAAGMTKVVLLLGGVLVPGWDQSSTYHLIDICADAGFYFMPVWICYGASQKLGGTPLISMLVAAAMFAPDFIALVEADPQTPQDIFGLPVALNSYANGLMPALLLSYAAYRFEKLFYGIIPEVVQSVFAGTLTVLCTYTLTMVLLAPLGTWIGDILVGVIMGIYGTLGPVAPALLGAALPFMIMIGVHMAFVPFMLQLLENPGYDALFRAPFILQNMAEGGACLGVALRTKNPLFRAEALSCAVTAIVAGVTEPALYGVTFRLRRPMIGVSAGCAIGAFVASSLGARGYSMGPSGIFGLPVFQETFVAAAIGIAVTIGVSALIAYILGFDESIIERDMAQKQAAQEAGATEGAGDTGDAAPTAQAAVPQAAGEAAAEAPKAAAQG